MTDNWMSLRFFNDGDAAVVLQKKAPQQSIIRVQMYNAINREYIIEHINEFPRLKLLL
jgi:hypothetical protein